MLCLAYVALGCILVLADSIETIFHGLRESQIAGIIHHCGHVLSSCVLQGIASGHDSSEVALHLLIGRVYHAYLLLDWLLLREGELGILLCVRGPNRGVWVAHHVLRSLAGEPWDLEHLHWHVWLDGVWRVLDEDGLLALPARALVSSCQLVGVAGSFHAVWGQI